MDTLNNSTIAIVTLILSLFTGLLGGIYSKKWEEITEEKVIVTRGKSAYRSLQLLLNSAISLERRVRIYLKRFSDEKYQENLNPEVLKTYLEEIIDECISLEQEVVNSIEDWTDILPNTEVKAIISLISDLNAKYDNAKAELDRVNSALAETQDRSTDEIEKLEEEKTELIKELDKIRKDLREKSSQAGIPTLSGSYLTGGGSALGSGIQYYTPSGTITSPSDELIFDFTAKPITFPTFKADEIKTSLKTKAKKTTNEETNKSEEDE